MFVPESVPFVSFDTSIHLSGATPIRFRKTVYGVKMVQIPNLSQSICDQIRILKNSLRLLQSFRQLSRSANLVSNLIGGSGLKRCGLFHPLQSFTGPKLEYGVLEMLLKYVVSCGNQNLTRLHHSPQTRTTCTPINHTPPHLYQETHQATHHHMTAHELAIKARRQSTDSCTANTMHFIRYH